MEEAAKIQGRATLIAK